jgi:formimidoylglutamate deiminase
MIPRRASLDPMNDPIGYHPDLIYTEQGWESGKVLVCHEEGRCEEILPASEYPGKIIRLPGRAILPGLVNAHSHAFQRVIRGRTEFRSSHSTDSFWTWRETMYSAARRLSPEDIYDASRMAFLEMALTGITTVGEFHYLHYSSEGERYAESNLLAKLVVQAAWEVGIRITLLRVAYLRSGFGLPPNPDQLRFIEPAASSYLGQTVDLQSDLAKYGNRAKVGLAAHSVRAVPLDQLKRIAEYSTIANLPLHMHVAEQPAEIDACIAEYGAPPVKLLADHGILSKLFTGVHGVHLRPGEIDRLAISGARICACPTTERNLGDGIIPADALLDMGVPLSLGTDSQVQIDLLEDARSLEYQLRLQKLQRNVLVPRKNGMDALAQRLFACATIGGGESLGMGGGKFFPGYPADFFTVDLEDPSIAGANLDDLLPNIVFAGSRAAVKDVCVSGKLIVQDGSHQLHKEIVERFVKLQRKLWN